MQPRKSYFCAYTLPVRLPRPGKQEGFGGRNRHLYLPLEKCQPSPEKNDSRAAKPSAVFLRAAIRMWPTRCGWCGRNLRLIWRL